MNDHIMRGLSASGGIRILTCSVTSLAREICSLQGTSPTASIAMGRGLAGGALMGALLKERQRVGLKFEGNGPLRKLIIEADADGAVRGAAGNPAADAEPSQGRWDVAGIIGRAGFLTVSKDLGLGGDLYQGMVQLRSSEIGDDLAYYLTDSEQVPSAVGVGSHLDDEGNIIDCGGFLVQALPKADPDEIDRIMSTISTLSPITGLLREGGPRLVMEKLFGEVAFVLLETKELFFRCGCSLEKVERALLSLGTNELTEMAASGSGAEVSCEFCRRRYQLETAELERLIALAGSDNRE